MKIDATEEKLRRMFCEMRRLDALRTPPFDRLARVPKTFSPFPKVWLRAAAAAVLIGLCAGAAVFFIRTHQSAADLQQWAQVSQWQASTDSLLTVSYTPWGSKMSTPTDAWIKTRSIMSETGQTNEKEML